MRLSEIAEFIVKNDPNCCMVYNDEIIPGCRENWYEEFLIKPLVDYYMFDVLHLCGCGCPEDTYEVIRRYLRIRKDNFDDELSWEAVQRRYKLNLHIDTADDVQDGLLQFMMYILDKNGFTEHGGSIGGCWLTKDGERLLTVLDAWYEKEYKKL